MTTNNLSVGLILLAAGASTRMGCPKQLLLYQGRSLVRYMAEIAIFTHCEPITVVLGSNADRIRQEINDLPLHIVENKQWSAGMSSSIRAGMKKLTTVNQHLDAVIVTLGDQPMLTSSKLNQLIETYQITQSSAIASAYANTLGVPALFSHILFPELLNLTAKVGAKNLIERYIEQVEQVSFPEGAFDLDTPEDYQQLCSKQNKPRVSTGR